jgi:hypothetical protein
MKNRFGSDPGSGFFDAGLKKMMNRLIGKLNK